MTVAEYISRQKGRPQMAATLPSRPAVVVAPRSVSDETVRARALMRAAEIVLIHFPGDVGEWTLSEDNRTVVLDDETTFSIYDF